MIRPVRDACQSKSKKGMLAKPYCRSIIAVMKTTEKISLNTDKSPFCLDETRAIREHICNDLTVVVSGILETVRPFCPVTAIALIGGFGRGEGGVITREGKPRPVNDYDLLVVVPRRSVFIRRRIRRALAALSAQLETQLGVAVDLDMRDPADLAAVPNIIAWYEVQAGNKIIWGDRNALEPMPSMNPRGIPLWDGTLLLFNRAGGLLIARRMLLQNRLESVDDRSYLVIQLSKSALALGDCLLIREGKYCASYVERAKRADSLNVSDLPDGKDIIKQYKAALAQKVRPDFAPLIEKDLRGWFEETVARHAAFFKWWEEQHWGRSFATWREYAEAVPLKLGERGSRLKNCAANILRLGAAPEPRRYMLPLQERLIDAMPLLLFEPTPDNLARAARILRIPANTTDQTRLQVELINRYVSLWH